MEHQEFNRLVKQWLIGMNKLEIYTVYNSPSDYPGLFVVRKYIIEATPPGEGNLESVRNPTADPQFILTGKKLENVRQQMERMGLFPVPRFPEDDPVIVENWI